MKRSLVGLVVLAAGLSVASCTLTLAAFVVPAQVWTNHEFEILVQANVNPNNPTFGNAGCILQLPVGFTVQASVPIHDGSQSQFTFTPTRDEPALMQNYTAEPGHYLAAFSGADPPMIALKVIVRAPPSPVAQQTIKVALAGSSGPGTPYQVNDPPGVTAF